MRFAAPACLTNLPDWIFADPHHDQNRASWSLRGARRLLPRGRGDDSYVAPDKVFRQRR